LIGMPASGKSTIGKMLASELEYRFTDLDVYIREKEGLTVQEIINRRGEAALMELEKKYMSEIDLRRRVVAPGGSLIYQTGLLQELKQKAVIVYLDETLANLEKRLKNAATRGIIGLKGKTLAEIYAERTPLYTRYAELVIRTDDLTRIQIAREIVYRLRSLP